jgi:hypothetical protein
VSLRKPLGKVQLLVGLPAPQGTGKPLLFLILLSAFWQTKKDLQVLLTFRAEKVVPLLLLGFKNAISLATSWRRVATATHLTYLSCVWSKQWKVGVQLIELCGFCHTGCLLKSVVTSQ